MTFIFIFSIFCFLLHATGCGLAQFKAEEKKMDAQRRFFFLETLNCRLAVVVCLCETKSSQAYNDAAPSRSPLCCRASVASMAAQQVDMYDFVIHIFLVCRGDQFYILHCNVLIINRKIKISDSVKSALSIKVTIFYLSLKKLMGFSSSFYPWRRICILIIHYASRLNARTRWWKNKDRK